MKTNQTAHFKSGSLSFTLPASAIRENRAFAAGKVLQRFISLLLAFVRFGFGAKAIWGEKFTELRDRIRVRRKSHARFLLVV